MSAHQHELSVVLVHYRTPDRLRRSVRELIAHCDASAIDSRIVVVDNSGDAPTASELGVEVLAPGSNLGYAGAANYGMRSSPDGLKRSRFWALLNPDVSLHPGCLRSLIEQCPAEGAVGPLFFWDEEQRLLIPPTEQHHAPLGLRLLAKVAPTTCVSVLRRRWRRHARKHWNLAPGDNASVRSRHLSGALLLFSAEALHRVGPFDESFRLYFEECDWLRRATAAGVETRMVGGARAVHEWNQSAALEPRAEDWFGESKALFERRYRLQPVRALEGRGGEVEEWSGVVEVPRGCRALWFEISAWPGGFPAAGERVEVGGGQLRWQPPPSLAKRICGWWLTVSDERRRELGRFRLADDAGVDLGASG